MPVSNAQLQEIRELIKSGKRKQAVSKLATLIERDPDNPDLWWLLANASEDIAQAKMAAEQLLSLRPDDQRAQKLLKRLETRQLLHEMGVKRPARANSNRRVLIFMGITALIVLAAFVVVLVATTRPDTRDVAQLPTQIVLPSLTPSLTPSATASPTVTPEISPTAPQVPASEITQEANAAAVAPEVTTPAFAPEVTDAPDFYGAEITAEPAADTNSNASGFTRPPQQPTEGFSFTLVTQAPQDLSPEVTEEAEIYDPADDYGFDYSDYGDAPFDAEVTLEAFDPEVTQEMYFDPSTGQMRSVIPPTPTPRPAEKRGLLTDTQPIQEIIRPYAEHAWTFSGYRGEKIRVEVLSITGTGSPSLLLLDPSGVTVAEDVDVVSGNNKDAVLDLALPADGIYTVVVRMAAVSEQLYYMTLKRGG